MSPLPRPEPSVVCLRHRERDITLPAGIHDVGRHASCRLRLHSDLASRLHARLHVLQDGLSIEDLSSANGVYVNGERIESGLVRLHGGDRVLLGQDEIEVLRESDPVSRQRSSPRPPSFAESDTDARTVSSGPGTQTANFFELVGKIVDRAIEEGRVDDASTMLRSQLGRILADARRGRRLDPPVRDGTLRYALALASVSPGSEWHDYVLDFLTAVRWAPEGELRQAVENVMATASTFDDRRLAAYITALDTSSENLNSLRILNWARGLGSTRSRRSPSGTSE